MAVSGLARTYEEYRQQLRSFSKEMYSDILADLSDASIGQWCVDLISSIGDNLSVYIDRAFQETNINEAQTRRALLAIARTKGLKIPGPKASLCEVELTCELPLNKTATEADWNYAPLLRKGCQASGGGSSFELLTDVDFATQFNADGVSNRIILPKRDSNGNLVGYVVKKREVMSATTTKYYKQTITDSMLTPFMEIILPDDNVVQVESIIFKEGTNYSYTPFQSDFTINEEYLGKEYTQDGKPTWRYFEMDSLLEDKLFLPQLVNQTKVNGKPTYPAMNMPNRGNPIYNVVKGEWKYLSQKFITEFTDKGYLKIIFGAGDDYTYVSSTAIERQMSRIINNKLMGILPAPDTTMWIQYRVGGGKTANVPPKTVTNWVLRDFLINGSQGDPQGDAVKKNNVYKSISVTNTSASVGGKDAPSNEEIRYMIKYNNMSNKGCVSVKDYYNKINNLPAIYGVPYRFGVMEKNNKILVSILSIDNNGKASQRISSTMMENISTYLSEFKMIGDYIDVSPGRVINIQVECDVAINKAYNNNDVVGNIINAVYNFFNMENHGIGDTYYCSALIRDVLNVAGVANLIELRIYNVFNGNYSTSHINQATVQTDNKGENRRQIDLVQSENILFSDTDSIIEVRDINTDIKVLVKNI